MSGYRQTSYDPEAYEQPGPPLRPYNGVQRTGVVIGIVGFGYVLVWLAHQIGWIETPLDGLPGIMLCLIGSALINSRRGPGVLVGEEQLARNRRLLAITIAVLGLLALILLLVQFSGVI